MNKYFEDMVAERHPGVREIVQWFDFDHLPTNLRLVSRECAELAEFIVTELPDSPELTAGLRKLLEAKDCFVRAAIAAQPGDGQ